METMEGELCRLLIDCLKKDESEFDAARLSGLSPERWQVLLTLTASQRVRPLLWHRLRQKGLGDAVPIKAAESLRNASRRNTLRNLRFYGELRHLLSALKPEEIPLILLKGIFLADAVYGNMGLREMNDIDVLIRPVDLARIAEILTGMGYTPLHPICADIALKTQHHLPRMVKNGHAAFEIHWNLTKPGESYSIDPGGLWERAVPVHIAGCDALTLSPEDLLLHLCLHTSYQHGFAFGLRPTDMTEAVFETARTQVFTDKSFAVSIPVPFAERLQSMRLWDKIRIFWQRVFLPRVMIAAQYSVPMDSVRIYGCYPRRLFDLLRRHGQTLKKYRQKDAPLQALAGRTNLVANWLARPATASGSRIRHR